MVHKEWKEQIIWNQSCLSHLLAVWPWEHYLTSLNCSCLIHQKKCCTRSHWGSTDKKCQRWFLVQSQHSVLSCSSITVCVCVCVCACGSWESVWSFSWSHCCFQLHCSPCMTWKSCQTPSVALLYHSPSFFSIQHQTHGFCVTLVWQREPRAHNRWFMTSLLLWFTSRTTPGVAVMKLS